MLCSIAYRITALFVTTIYTFAYMCMTNHLHKIRIQIVGIGLWTIRTPWAFNTPNSLCIHTYVCLVSNCAYVYTCRWMSNCLCTAHRYWPYGLLGYVVERVCIIFHVLWNRASLSLLLLFAHLFIKFFFGIEGNLSAIYLIWFYHLPFTLIEVFLRS